MTEFAIYLFGFPRIERSGSKLALDRRKALALVAYLAVTGGSHGREELAALLWPELDNARARRALRRTLFAFREAAGEGLLVVNGDELALETRGVWCDARQFLRASEPGVSRDALKRARELYRGDFLQGFSVHDAFPFEQWLLLEAETFRNRAVSALERLVTIHTAEDRIAEALEDARRLLREDPFHERAHRSVMELYQRQGRPERAIEQFDRYRKLLREQLNADPSPELVEMRARVQSARPAVEPREPEELRTKWSRAIENEHWHELAELLDGVTESFDIRGRFEEGAIWLRAALGALPNGDPLVGKLLIRLGALEVSRGRFVAARDALERGLVQVRRRGEHRESAIGFNRFGYVAFAFGRREQSFRSLGRSISMFRDLRDRAGLAWALNVLGHLNAETGNVARARALLEESLGLASDLGQGQRIASTFNSLGKTSLREGKLEAAHELLQQGLRLRRGLGHRIGVADSLNNLGDVISASEERDDAMQHYQQALTVALEIQALPLVMEIFVAVAGLLRQRNEVTASVSLLTLARHHDASWWEAKRRAASGLSKLAPALSRTDFARAAEEGRAMSCSEAASRFGLL